MSKMVEAIAQSINSFLSIRKMSSLFGPAMDLDMYNHPSTKNNINKLQEFGNKMIPVTHGELASGLIGKEEWADLRKL